MFKLKKHNLYNTMSESKKILEGKTWFIDIQEYYGNFHILEFRLYRKEKDDLELVFQKETPDYVIHLAAQTSVNFSISHPYYDANMNVMASIKLLELCKKYNIRKFITASSAAIYGNPKYLPIDENHPTEPMSQYGLSKLTMEARIML